MKEQITLNKNQLNTSKLQTKQKIKDKDGKFKPIDQIRYYHYVSKNMG